jgi:hypothetical protein
MEEKNSLPENENHSWWQVLRPLAWWLLLALILYGIRTHQRLMATTSLNFSVTLAGQVVYGGTMATFDGHPIGSGELIPLGEHTFVITNPKGVTFATNLFIWYGGRNFGTIDLNRATGTLIVSANPPAPLLSIQGPEWSVILTNSTGLTATIPTDRYAVTAHYAHWDRSDTVTVMANAQVNWPITPRLGVLQLDCNQADTTFQLMTANEQLMESGRLPAIISDLPEGEYTLDATHHGHELDSAVKVTSGATNHQSTVFEYGTAHFDTTPAGAGVMDDAGRVCGITPLTLPELEPGPRRWMIHLAGYEATVANLQISANETATFETNLISLGYTAAMKAAADYLAQADYDRAAQACGDALAAKPDDGDAIALGHKAKGLGDFQRAKALGDKGDYIGGGKWLASASQELPDNEEIKTAMADFKQREPEQIGREQAARQQRPRAVFDVVLARVKNSELFEDHELKTTKPASEAAPAIVQALLAMRPAFKIDVNKSSEPDIFEIVGRQDVPGLLTSSGFRRCLIVCGQASDTETRIYFKVLEYETKHNVTMTGPLAFKDQQEFIPIGPSRIPDMTEKLKAQLQTGVSNVTAQIQEAVGP